MKIQYITSPIYYANSIFLAYDEGQPFASLGSKTLMPGSPRVSIASAPPKDDQSRALISEFLRLCMSGNIGPMDYSPWGLEAGPKGKRNNLYRSDLRSHYADHNLNDISLPWFEAQVTFEDKRVPMFWNIGSPKDYVSGNNERASKLALQPDTALPAPFTPSNLIIRSDAYLLLNQMWKPYTDICSKRYPRAADVERVVRPLFKGWWRACSIKRGWRLYADDENELLFAKLAIPV